MLKKLHEGHFSVLVLAAAAGISYIAGVTQDGLTEVLGNNVTAMATYLAGATGLTALYGTLDLNVKDQIIENKNTALGIVLAGLYIGLGFAIRG